MNDSRPWWLWPNLLALDAPAVAVTWQVFLASVAGIAVPLAASVVLALVVWAVYLADRGLDARRGANGSDRHRAAGRNLAVWIATALLALAAAIVVSLTVLPRSHLYVGFVVAGAAFAYFAAVHVLPAKRVLDRGVKEASVGVVFAAGAAIPLFAEARPYTNWLAGVVAFAGLCWLNCVLISLWEDASAAPPFLVVVAAACLAVGATLGASIPVTVAIIGSTAALGALHVFQPRISLRASRVLADTVLLSPILVAVWK